MMDATWLTEICGYVQLSSTMTAFSTRTAKLYWKLFRLTRYRFPYDFTRIITWSVSTLCQRDLPRDARGHPTHTLT